MLQIVHDIVQINIKEQFDFSGLFIQTLTLLCIHSAIVSFNYWYGQIQDFNELKKIDFQIHIIKRFVSHE